MLFLNRNSSQVVAPQNNQDLLKDIPLVNTVDLTLNKDGDLAISSSGDLKVVGTSDLVISNLFRRLTTPQGGYERYFFNASKDLVEYDSGWSNPILNQISAPLTASLAVWAADRLKELSAVDARINLISVSQSVNGQQVELVVKYSLQDGVARSANIPLPA
jgi:hypothetical protein